MTESFGIETKDWIFVRMLDKISRIWELIKRENKVLDEKIEDTLLDLANYSIILFIYINYKSWKTT